MKLNLRGGNLGDARPLPNPKLFNLWLLRKSFSNKTY
jgi:hypothetical protein